MHEKDT